MSDREPTPEQRWVETWLRAGPELERIRHEELRSRSDEDLAREIDELCQLAVHFAQPRLTSGLVEQQRWFQEYWQMIKDRRP